MIRDNFLKKSTSRFLVIGTILLLFGLFLCGFLPRLFQTEKILREATKNVLPQVTIMVAQPKDQPLELILPSVTQANHWTPIWARTNGYLVKLFVDIGDVVKEGQLLAVLDTPEVDEQYFQAIHDLESAKARYDIAQILAERGKKLFAADAEAISQEDLDQRIAASIAAEADVRSFEANKDRYKDLMDFKNIVAPFDGIIIERAVDIGSLVSAGSNGSPQQLFVIATSDIIRVFVSVPQSFFRSIHEGVEGLTTIREFPNKSFKSTVARYAKSLDQTAHTMLTELHIDNKNGELLPGLYAEVQFSIKPTNPYFILPTPALIIRAGDPKVAVVDEQDIVHLKSVKIGLDYGKAIEIIEGIAPNERIVIDPTEKIREGIKVQIFHAPNAHRSSS